MYGSADLPCELGSGSGNVSTSSSTAGGGIIGNRDRAYGSLSIIILYSVTVTLSSTGFYCLSSAHFQ